MTVLKLVAALLLLPVALVAVYLLVSFGAVVYAFVYRPLSASRSKRS